MTKNETHEPAEPVDWPHGHVAVARMDAVGRQGPQLLTTDDVDVSLTDATSSECIAVDLADTRHFLHSTTARELSNMLLSSTGCPSPLRSMASTTARAVQQPAP